MQCENSLYKPISQKASFLYIFLCIIHALCGITPVQPVFVFLLLSLPLVVSHFVTSFPLALERSLRGNVENVKCDRQGSNFTYLSCDYIMERLTLLQHPYDILPFKQRILNGTWVLNVHTNQSTEWHKTITNYLLTRYVLYFVVACVNSLRNFCFRNNFYKAIHLITAFVLITHNETTVLFYVSYLTCLYNQFTAL